MQNRLIAARLQGIQSRHVSSALSNGPRVLLVDDTLANLLALTAVLQPIGAELLEARSGEEAIALVKDH